MKNYLLTLVYGAEMAKTFYCGKWYRAGGCGYNKQKSLLDGIFGVGKWKIKIEGESFKVAGWEHYPIFVEVA